MLQNDMINLADIEEVMNKNKREEILKQHPYEIWQGKDDGWYTYLPDKTNKRKLKRRAKKSKLEDDIVEYYLAVLENPCIIDLFNEWNDERIENEEIGKNSYTKYSNDFKRFFKADDTFCTIPVKEIAEADITKFIKMNIKRYELSRKSYASMRTLIIGVFKYAKSKKLTEISISTYFSDLQLSNNLFKKNKKSAESQVFNEDETIAVTRYLRENQNIHNLGLLLLFETGLRVGELCVLKPEHILPEGIKVESTEIYYKDSETNKNVFEIKETPKMGADDRIVVIPPQARETLRKIKLMNPFGEFLFMKNNKRIHSIRFNYYLYKACKAVGIPERSTHKIRKTYASKLIDANVEEALIQSQMGHSDIKTTRDYYYFCTQNQSNKEKQISGAVNL